MRAAKAAAEASATAPPRAAAPSTPPQREPSTDAPSEPAPAPAQEQEPEKPRATGMGPAGLEDLAWAGIAVTAEAATLGVRLVGRAFDAARRAADRG